MLLVSVCMAVLAFDPAASEPPDPSAQPEPEPAQSSDSQTGSPDFLPLPSTAPSPPPPLSPVAPGWEPRRYGDQGTSEIAIGLGYSSDTGFLAAGGFRYFVADAIAPGLEATYVSGGRLISTFGLILGALRVVPIRSRSFALVLTGRAGRVLLASHADGWAAGGGAGIIVLLGATVGLEIGYEALRLLPSDFCADLSSCVLHGPVLGLRLVL